MFKLMKAVFTQKTHEGTTERLLQFSAAYFFFYVLTGFLAKYFEKAYGIGGTTYTVYNTIGGMLVCVLVVLFGGWYKFQSGGTAKLLGFHVPREFLYIIPSGVCTAVVIPTTTLMYTLPISVMVAMIIMRASIIVISRAIDEVQIRQGILKKTVYWEENVAVVIALSAVSLQLLNFKGAISMAGETGNYAAFFGRLFVFDPANFDFLGNAAAMTILTFYLIAYTVRIYIMNYYKNTRPRGAAYDTKGFFAIEQIASTLTIMTAGLIYFYSVDPDPVLGAKTFAFQFSDAFINAPANRFAVILSGIPFGMAAFFSVFLFMFKGRTATFAGLVNRLTSLIAGTAATVLAWKLLGLKTPKFEDWIGLALMFLAIYFIGKAEKKRACELARTHEVEPEKGSEVVCEAKK